LKSESVRIPSEIVLFQLDFFRRSTNRPFSWWWWWGNL